MCPFAVATHSSYSCLENSMDRGSWRAKVHGVAKSWAWLSDFTFALLLVFKTSFISVVIWVINIFVPPFQWGGSHIQLNSLLSESSVILGFQCCHAFFFFFFWYAISFTLSAIGFDTCILSCVHHYSVTQSSYIILKFLVSCIQPSLQWLLKTIDLMTSP